MGDHEIPQMKLEYRPQNIGNNVHLSRRENIRGDGDKCIVGFFLSKKKPTFMNVKMNAERIRDKTGFSEYVL